MLNAFKNYLSLLVVEGGDAYSKRIKKRLGKKFTDLHLSKSINLILIMPHLIALSRELSNAETVSPSLKRLNGYLLTYFYPPPKSIAEENGGLLGYLDDAYLVGSVVQRLKSQAALRTENLDLVKDLEDSLQKTREIIKKESRRIDHLVAELEDGKTDIFEKIMKREAKQPKK